MQLAEGGYSFVFLVEEVQAGLPVEGAEFALKRVMKRLKIALMQIFFLLFYFPSAVSGRLLFSPCSSRRTVSSAHFTGVGSKWGGSRYGR